MKSTGAHVSRTSTTHTKAERVEYRCIHEEIEMGEYRLDYRSYILYYGSRLYEAAFHRDVMMISYMMSVAPQ